MDVLILRSFAQWLLPLCMLTWVLPVYASDSVQLARQVQPAVVTLSTKRALLFSSSEKPNSKATGFFISPQLILTANHAIDGARTIGVALSDTRQLEAKLVRTWPEPDIALLRIDGAGPAYLRLASNQTPTGEPVWAFGAPFEFDVLMTQGIISSNSVKALSDMKGLNLLATDAVINPGMSGGPLTNASGEVVGLISQIFSTNGSYSGISLAVPASQLQKLLSAGWRDEINGGLSERR